MIPRKEVKIVADMGKWKQSQVNKTVIRKMPASSPPEVLNKNKMKSDSNIILVFFQF